VFVKINGETRYLWRAVDHEGEVLESFVRPFSGRTLHKSGGILRAQVSLDQVDYDAEQR
jgi:hypothetical protein